jgi:hypothetical protein
MAPNVGTEHSQTQESLVQYALEASAAVDETSVLATNIETASTENSTTHADMLTTAGSGALQDIYSQQTSNMKRHDQNYMGGGVAFNGQGLHLDLKCNVCYHPKYNGSHT